MFLKHWNRISSIYCKQPEKFRHTKKCCYYPKILTVWFYYRVMHPKDADRVANSVNLDQEQSDLGLYCLPWPGCLKTESFTNKENKFSATARFLVDKNGVKCLCRSVSFCIFIEFGDGDFYSITTIVQLQLRCLFMWATPWENVSSVVSDQVRLKLACSATVAS